MAHTIDFRLDASFLSRPKIIKLRRRLGAGGVLAWIALLWPFALSTIRTASSPI